jgi:hypothetical protein
MQRGVGLEHAIWLGGLAGAGKTTVARRLAQRWGLRIYSSDNWTWIHRDRAIAAGIAAAIRFEELTPVERARASHEEREAMWLGEARAVMVVDDVGSFPTAPLVVAEGAVIAPHLIDSSRAVWLQPTEEFQAKHRLKEWTAIGYSSEQATRFGIPVVEVDGSRGVLDVVAEVQEVLAKPLAAGPHAQSATERRSLLREANLAAVRQVRDGCARPWATADPESQVRSFVCECGRSDCDRDVDVAVGSAAATPVLARGHESG